MQMRNHVRIWIYWFLLLCIVWVLSAETKTGVVSTTETLSTVSMVECVKEKAPIIPQSLSDTRSVQAAQIVRVFVNTATVHQLETLPGIGPVLAERIVISRELEGPYHSVADLQRVTGIGKKKCENIKYYVIID